MTIGERLRFLRLRNNLTQEELGDKINVVKKLDDTSLNLYRPFACGDEICYSAFHGFIVLIQSSVAPWIIASMSAPTAFRRLIVGTEIGRAHV